MAEYKGRRARKRAHGGATGGEGEGPPHGHMLIMIGLAPKKAKKKAGGKVEGVAARKHLGKRARGGIAKRADGGATDDDAPLRPGTSYTAANGKSLSSLGPMEPDGRLRQGEVKTTDPDYQKAREAEMARTGRARGGRADGPRILDAREDANEPDQDGRDKVSQRSGTDERAVEMGDARARGGRTDHWIQGANEKMEKKGTKGALHRSMGVPAGEKIPEHKMAEAKAKAERSGDTKMIRRITFAENVRH